MIGLTPPIPWGLVAAAVITVVVAGSGWTILHGLRKSDAAEIASLAAVATRNAEVAHRQGVAANAAQKAAQEASEGIAQARLETARHKAALKEVRDGLAEDDPCLRCTVVWPDGMRDDAQAEDGT